jgi:hypothetical protein
MTTLRAQPQASECASSSARPAALHYQHSFLELGRLHRRSPARGAGPDDDEIEMLRDAGGKL